jgi:hypothetical protein
VTVIDWFRAVRGHAVGEEIDAVYRAAVSEYLLRRGRATGHEVLCIGTAGEPYVMHTSELREPARERTGRALATRRRQRDDGVQR